MTNYEFKAEYDKLVEVYPSIYGNQHKEKAIFNYIKDLDVKWWRALATRIILSSNPRIDIEDAARGERIARKRLEETKAMLRKDDSRYSQDTGKGYEEILKEFNVKSLAEVIGTKQRGESD